MDEKRSKAVTEAFCRLHEEGLIYRDVGRIYRPQRKDSVKGPWLRQTSGVRSTNIICLPFGGSAG
ncbi:valine--tRNA ligase [Orobanche gracilis]